MKKLTSEPISVALYRMSRTRELLDYQRNSVLAIINEGIVRRATLKEKTEEVDQRLARLQVKIDKVKKAGKIV